MVCKKGITRTRECERAFPIYSNTALAGLECQKPKDCRVRVWYTDDEFVRICWETGVVI